VLFLADGRIVDERAKPAAELLIDTLKRLEA
jgi:hypothetical protein